MAAAKPAKQSQAATPKLIKKNPPKGKQVDLPGMEDRGIREIEDAANAYADIRDERAALSKKEKAAKDVLISVMRKHEKKVYNVKGLVVTCDDVTKATVEREKKPEGEEDDYQPGLASQAAENFKHGGDE